MPWIKSHFMALLAAFMIAVTAMGAMPSAAFAQGGGAPAPAPAPSSGWGFEDLKTLLLGDPVENAKSTSDQFVREYGQSCWACSVFNGFSKVVFDKGHNIAASQDNNFLGIMTTFAVLFSLWYLGGGIMVGDAGDMAQRWKVFWRLMLAVAAAGVILRNNSFDTVWRYVYGPLMSIPLGIQDALGGVGGGLTGNNVAGVACNPGYVAPPNVGAAGAGALMKSMFDIVCGGHKVSVGGMGYAYAISQMGSGIVGTLMNVMMGAALFVVFTWLAISFPLRFIDVLIRLAVIGVLTPIFVICAVFKPTRSYVQIAVSNVLYSGALFAFTAIMFNIGGGVFQELMDKYMAGQSGTMLLPGELTVAETLGRGFALIGMGVVFASMIKMAPALAQEFSGFKGSSGSIGDAAAGAAAGTASLAVKGAGAAVGGVAGAKVAGAAAGTAAAQAQGVQKGISGPTG